jgi:hypothetical protein
MHAARSSILLLIGVLVALLCLVDGWTDGSELTEELAHPCMALG